MVVLCHIWSSDHLMHLRWLRDFECAFIVANVCGSGWGGGGGGGGLVFTIH